MTRPDEVSGKGRFTGVLLALLTTAGVLARRPSSTGNTHNTG
ncbi:hypothetical protein [Streptomyces bobili]